MCTVGPHTVLGNDIVVIRWEGGGGQGSRCSSLMRITVKVHIFRGMRALKWRIVTVQVYTVYAHFQMQRPTLRSSIPSGQPQPGPRAFIKMAQE